METCFNGTWFDASTPRSSESIRQNLLREAISIHETNMPAANLIWLFRYGSCDRGLSAFLRESLTVTVAIQRDSDSNSGDTVRQ
jgi:hypothetical protein